MKRIQSKVEQEVVKLQHENQIYRATNDLPQDLLQAVKTGTLLQEGKQKKKKICTKIDMSDLAGAMDRI